MSQVFNENGEVIPVTLVQCEKNTEFEGLASGAKVKVVGTSKGKGFAGVMKRWGFAGGPATHGQSDRARAPGSIGATTTPGRVFKGKKMPGRMGGDRVTVRGLRVIEVDAEHATLKISGAIPGRRGSKVEVVLYD